MNARQEGAGHFLAVGDAAELRSHDRNPRKREAAGARGTNSSADGGHFKRETETANAKAVCIKDTTADQLVAILARRHGLSLPVARTVREAAFGLGGGHGR